MSGKIKVLAAEAQNCHGETYLTMTFCNDNGFLQLCHLRTSFKNKSYQTFLKYDFSECYFAEGAKQLYDNWKNEFNSHKSNTKVR